MSSETLVSRFYAEAVRIPDAPVLMVKRDGKYRAVSWRELEQHVRSLSTALIGLGVRPGDRVGILSENRQEWIEADFAIMSVGAITVALHAALTSRQVRDQFTDAEPVVVFASHPEQLEKLLEVWGALPSVKTIVPFEPATFAEAGLTPYTDVLEAGTSPSETRVGELDRRIRDVKPADTAAIIYTSGTTGESKGAMLTHSNFASNVKAMIARQPPEDVGEQAVTLVYLPLSHVYARTCDLYMGLSTERALALAVSIDTLMLNLQEVQPHTMIGVPRVYEKLVSAARERQEAGDRNGLRNVLGGRIRWCSGGGAALSPEIARLFFEAGVPIYQGYGLTETSPVISMSCDGQSKFGAAGTLIERVEVKIAPDGEILSRGPHIMKGYWNKPQATADVIDSEGWFHTGDVGRLDDEGFLFITDRKKDIFVSSYGKNIAPQLIEGLLAFDAFIEQACIYGDGKKYLTALVVPAAPPLLAWAATHLLTDRSVEELVREPTLPGVSVNATHLRTDRSVEELVAMPEVHAMYAERIATALADLAEYERIKDFVLLAEPFSAASGTMTCTAKLRRRQIIDLHREALEALYAD